MDVLDGAAAFTDGDAVIAERSSVLLVVLAFVAFLRKKVALPSCNAACLAKRYGEVVVVVSGDWRVTVVDPWPRLNWGEFTTPPRSATRVFRC